MIGGILHKNIFSYIFNKKLPMKQTWPNNKKFAFTIVDDTDNSTVFNVKPVYDFLYRNNIITTKTVWVYPSRNKFTGGSLVDPEYLDFILDLQNKGYEIALHNVGSGAFERDEIVEGIKIFEEKLKHKPKMHIDHASNEDNIYSGYERFQTLTKYLILALYGNRRICYGSNPESKYFWGDISKKHIKYMRNYTFNNINTLKIDPLMPYIDKQKEEFSNYWFSSSDGHTVEEFNALLTKHNIDKLEKEGGLCIIYTHFSSQFVDDEGKLNSNFIKNVDYLASKNAWFAPASEILDYLQQQKKLNNKSDYASKLYLNRLDFKWIIDRVIKKIRFGK